MATTAFPWTTLGALCVAVGLLYFLNQWIGKHIQGIGVLMVGHPEAGMVLAWLVFLPGVFLHELSHWLMAWILGLQPGKLRVWPERVGKNMLRMGYVDFRSGDALRDSLVGLAPFLTGSAFLLLLASQLFAGEEIRGLDDLLRFVRRAVEYPDFWLYAYLAFAVANGMMPSASDRQSWGSVLLYAAAISSALYALDLLPALPPAFMQSLFSWLKALTYAIGLGVLIDLPIALVLLVVEEILSQLTGQRVQY